MYLNRQLLHIAWIKIIVLEDLDFSLGGLRILTVARGKQGSIQLRNLYVAMFGKSFLLLKILYIRTQIYLIKIIE